MNLQVLREMGGISNSSAANAGATRDLPTTSHQLDDTLYDGATFYFEILAENNDSVDRDFFLINSSGTVKATITIPAGQTTPKRIRSTAFTPDSGATIYLCRITDTTNANEVICYVRRIVVDLVNATKAEIQIPLVGRIPTFYANVDGNTFIWSANPTAYAESVPLYHQLYQKDESKFAAITGWRFEAVIWSSADTASAELYNFTDSTQVATLTNSGDPLVPTLKTVDIANDAANFDDLDDFIARFKNSSTFSHCRMSSACLYCKINPISEVEVWHQILRGTSQSGDTVWNQQRLLYEPSKFSAPEAFFHASGRESVAGDISLYLRDHGTNDDGTGGTDVAASQIEFDSGTRNQVRTSSIQANFLVDSDRYLASIDQVGAGGDTIDINAAFLIIRATPLVGSPVETFDWEESPYADLFNFLASASPAETFGWTASPQGGVYPFVSPTELTENFALSASPRAALFSFLSPSPIEEDFAFGASPLEYELGPYFGPGALILAEVWLDAGTEYHSNLYVRHPTRVYEGRVTSFGTVDRSVPVPSGFPEVGDARIELADTDNKFRALFAVKTPRRRLLVLKMGLEGGSESLFQVIYTGEIKSATFPAGKTVVVAQDITFQFFEEKIPKLITANNFSLTEEQSEAFSPIVFGNVTSSGLNDQGAWDCPRLSSTRYNVARHPMASVTLYRKTPDAETYSLVSFGYSTSEETKTIDGKSYTFTHVDFYTPQEDGTLIRADGEGRLDDSSPPVVERNPAACIKDFLLNIADRPWADLNHTAFTDLEVTLDSLGYLCDGTIVTQMTYREALSRMVKSFNFDFYQDKDGRISIGLLTASDSSRPVFDDTLLIERDSVEQYLADPIANKIRYNYNRLADEWYTEQIYNNEIDQTALGEEEERTVDLWFVRDATTANGVINDYSAYLDLASHRIRFRVPIPRTLHMMELAKLVGVTHYAGLDASGSGFTNQEFKVTSISHDLQQLKTTIKAIRRNPLVEQKALLTGFWTLNSILGPWQGPAPGIFYVVPAQYFSGKTLKVMRTLDWGATWSWLETPTTTNNIGSHDTKASGIFLHIAIQETVTGRVSYWQYNMASEQWEVENETVVASFSPLGTTGVSIDLRALVEDGPTTEPVIFCQKATEEVSGTDYERVTAYRRTGAASWSNINVGRSAVPGDVKICRVIAVGPRLHFFYGYNYGAGGGKRQEYHQTRRANGSIGMPVLWLDGNLVYFGTNVAYNMGKPAVNGTNVVIPFKGWWGNPYYVSFTSEDDLEANPNYRLISGTFVFQGIGAAGTANYPAICMDFANDVLQTVFSHFVGDDRWEVHKTGFGPTPAATGDAANDNQCGPRTPWPTNEPQMTNALTFRYGNSDWIAKVFSVGSGQIGYELVPVDDLPRATTYTVSQFLADAS
jgi:hypothetical protein